MPDTRRRSTSRRPQRNGSQNGVVPGTRGAGSVRARRNPRTIIVSIVIVLVIGAIGIGAMVLTSPSRSAAPAAAPAGTPVVTQVALPDFGQVAQDTANDTAPVEIGTPTPGIAGPTAVVVTSSPWQVIVAPKTVPDMQSPSGIAVDNDGNFYVTDFENNFIQKFSA